MVKQIGSKVILISTIFLSLTINVFAEIKVQPKIEMIYDGGDNANDVAKAVVIENAGNIYVTGFCDDSILGSTFCTIKYNSNGVQEWISKYKSLVIPSRDTTGTSIGADNYGNVYVTGYVARSSVDADYCTIKYDSTGNQKWIARYNGPGNSDDKSLELAIDLTGNVYVTGFSGEDYMTIKYNSAGAQQWTARYDGPVHGNDQATSIAVDIAGNVFVGGLSQGDTTGHDYAIIKYDTNGIQQWVARYNGPGNDYDRVNSIGTDRSGNLYVTGSSTGMGTKTDYCTIKYDSTGNQKWVKRYDYSQFRDGASSLAVDSLENVYVTGGSCAGQNYGATDCSTIKYDSTGKEEWIARYNGPANSLDRGLAIALDSNRNVFITGICCTQESWNYDYCTIKYDSQGVEQWVATYNGPGNTDDLAYSLAVDPAGHVVVTGTRSGGNTQNDFYTVKYFEPKQIVLVRQAAPEFRLRKPELDPLAKVTSIQFDLPKESLVEIIIFDKHKREVIKLIDQQMEAGTYRLEWGVDDLPKGLYYCRLRAGRSVMTTQFVLE